MKIEFKLSFALFRAAYKLFWRRQLSARLIFPISVAMLIAGILGAVVVDERGPFGWLVSVCAGAIGGGVVGTLLLPLMRIYSVHRAYRHFLPSPVDDKLLSFEIDDVCISSLIPGVGAGTIQWSAICDFAQDEKVTLLYLTKKRFYFFPNSAMTPAQRAELADLIARSLPKGKS
jgi:uncharacterized membrane protein YeaQ/YmgE (transglycosylase-associated protein family)